MALDTNCVFSGKESESIRSLLPPQQLPPDLACNKALCDWNILLGYRGSVAHGMWIPNSDPNSVDDIDLMGICVPPLEYYFGLKEFGSRNTLEIFHNEWDIVVYECRKAVRLLAQANPNILSILWLEPDKYLRCSEAGKLLIQNRQLFATKKAYRSFIGYAKSQLDRMTRGKYEGYMGKKRKALVQKWGFDSKNAAHLIRLLRLGCEFLKYGELFVDRRKVGDADELLDIKTGKWSLERVKKHAEELFLMIDDVYAKSVLTEAVDEDRVSELCSQMVKLHLGL